MIMAKDSNNNYVKIEDIITQQNSFNGISPIKFKSSGENLENYRIYGNTVGGESVGDRTENLFDENSEPIPGYLNDGGAIATVPNYPISTYDYINVLPNTNYSYKAFIDAAPNNSTHKTIRVSYYTNSKVFISRYFEIDKGLTRKTITTPNNCFYVRLSIDDNLRNVMLWRGSSDVSVYEPCGYRVPVMVSNGTDTQIVPIYLPEQIRKVDDEAEYIDFEEQKQHFADGTSVDVTLPALPTLSGTNTLSVETNTKPSKVWGKLSDPRDILYVKDNLGNILFSKYHEIEGKPPLIYKSKKAGTLTDYRIYGQTSRNLFDMKTFAETCNQVYGTVNYINNTLTFTATNGVDAHVNSVYNKGAPVYVGERPSCIDVLPSTTYTISMSSAPKCYISWLNSSYEVVSAYTQIPANQKSYTFTTPSNCTKLLIRLGKEVTNIGDTFTISDIMLNEGPTPLPYEPYGESVGDRTGNLFDKEIEQGGFNADGINLNLEPTYSSRVRSKQYIFVTPNTVYSFSVSTALDIYLSVSFYDKSDYTTKRIGYINWSPGNTLTFRTPTNCTYIRVLLKTESDSSITPSDISNIMLNEGSTPLPYEPYGYKVPVTVEGKNLLPNTATSQTINGVTFTVNGDGSVTCNGTSTSQYYSLFRIPCYLVAGNYTISGCPVGGSSNKYRADIRISPNGGMVGADADIGAGATIPIDESGWYDYTIRIQGGYAVDDVTFKPMIRKADIEDDTYEPYRTPVTTPIYLPEQIRKVGDEAEYIDYGEQKQHRVRVNLSEVNEFSNSITDTKNRLDIWIQQGKNDSFAYPNQSGIFVIIEPTTITTNITITNGNDSIRIKHNGYTRDIVIDIVRGLSPGVYSVSFNILNYDSTTIGGVVINNIMVNKGSAALPYEPYIENTEVDVTLPALQTLPGTNVLSVGTEVQPSKIDIKGKIKGKIYGWHVDPDISDSSNAVTYLEDAIGMTPASMGFTTFDYGSWQNAFFMPKPCMLKSNGKIDYYLDPNDYTKKLDGTASDISNPNYDGNAMMQWPKIWFKYVKGVKEGQGYFYVANYKADGNYHCWCNYDSEDNEIDHFYTAIYNGTSFANYSSSKTYVINDFAIYDNKLYKCNTAITTAQAFDSTKWDVVSNTAPAINKMRSLSGIRLTNNNGNAQTDTTTETTRAEANNATAAKEWYIETFSDRLLINGLLVLMGKSLNTQAVFGRGLDTGSKTAKEAYITGTLNDKGLFYGVTGNGNSAVKVFGMENFWGCAWHRTAGLITNKHAIKLKLTYGTKDGSTVIGYNQTGNGYIDNGTATYSNEYVQKMSYNKYGFMPAAWTGGSQSTYYADYYYQNANYKGTIYALFGGGSNDGLDAGAFYLSLHDAPGYAYWGIAASLSCKPLL